MDTNALNTLKTLIGSHLFREATTVPIDEDRFVQSEAIKREWEENNKYCGLGKFAAIVALGCVIIRLLMINPQPLFDLVPIYVYLGVVVSMVLGYVVILFFALVLGFKARKATRKKALEAHFEASGVDFFDRLDDFSVPAIRKVNEDVQLAQEGDADALYRLSETLLSGKILKANYKMAISLAALAAELGNSRAGLIVAKAFNHDLYEKLNHHPDNANARDIQKDLALYTAWLQKASQLGSYEATRRLKEMGTKATDKVTPCSAQDVINTMLDTGL